MSRTSATRTYAEACGSAGGQGQYGRVVGYIEPLTDPEPGETVRFENNIVGNAIPPGFLPACEKGFKDATNSGHLIGHPVEVPPPSSSPLPPG
jgi:translation elongation factor EF-G